MIIRKRYAALGSLAVGTTVLMSMGAIAFACTTYQGKLTVTTGTASSVSQGTDNCDAGSCGTGDGSMTFCSTSLGAHVPHSTTNNSITVAMGTTNSCSALGYQESHLAANTTY
ncbi:MAG: hypothetical protein ACRDXE_09015, partial [Acidimicrobiales bacterium]